MSTEGGGQSSCARTEWGRGSVLGSSSSSVWDRAQSPTAAGLMPKVTAWGQEGGGSAMLFTNGNVELKLHCISCSCLPHAWLSPVHWKHPGGGGGGWPGRAGMAT